MADEPTGVDTDRRYRGVAMVVDDEERVGGDGMGSGPEAEVSDTGEGVAMDA